MIAGHTKFAPDGCFGLLKRGFKRHAVLSLEEFEMVVNESACVNQAQLIGKEDGSSFVEVGEWQQHLSPYFKPFPGIKKFQNFRFDAEHPGKLFAKISTDTEVVEFDLLRKPVAYLPRQGAQPIVPPGLPLQRQWYLYNQIREYVKDLLQDVVCPLPNSGAPIIPRDDNFQSMTSVPLDHDNDTDDYEVLAEVQSTRGRSRKRSKQDSESGKKQKTVNETRPRGRGRGRGVRGRGLDF